MLNKGQIVDLEIESAAYRGSAVARFKEMVVFVRGAVPGDRVRARITAKKRNYSEAAVERVIRPSKHRVEPQCRYFGVCGGCSWQNTDYSQQLDFKRQQVEEIFKHLAGIRASQIRSTLPAPQPYYYRNKMEFSFGANRWLMQEEIESGKEVWKGFALGLHVPKRWDKILDLEVCYLQSSESAEIVNEVRRISLQKGWSAYDSRKHKGYLRNLVVRTAHYTRQIMLNLVTSRSEPSRLQSLTGSLLTRFPEITTLVNSINPTRSPVASGTEEMVYHGPGTITEQIGKYVFEIAPDTFFQPNTIQAERLYGMVKDLAQLRGDEVLYDLYSGVGTVSLLLSEHVKRVIGIENHKATVRQAEKNASLNGVTNCTFPRLDVLQSLSEPFVRENGQPDVVITDPPRIGMHEDVCLALMQLAPQRIVYISCNPATQARDLRLLCRKYEIDQVQPVDMFPQTYHIENVVFLRRIGC